MTHLDYLLLPLNRFEGQDQEFLPGFFAAKAPRRASRSRKDDRLWFYVSFTGAFPYTDLQLQELLNDMARGYFHSSGAATSALLEQAERLNAFLFDQNQKQGQGSPAAIGHLTALLFRPTRLILAQSGLVHAFQLGLPGIEHFYDPENTGRGLGLARQTKARFYDLTLQAQDIFLVTHSIPKGWNESTLQNTRSQKLATLRRRFLGDAGEELSGVMMAVREGQGAFEVIGSSQELSSPAEEATQPEKTSARPADQFVQSGNAEQQLSAQAWEQIDVPPEDADEDESLLAEEAKTPAPNRNMPSMARQPGPQPNPAKDILVKVLGYLTQGWQRIQTWLARVLPQNGEFNLPSNTMAWIAGLVPVVVVLLVSLLYFQVGRGQLYRNYLARAQASIAEASAIEDSLDARESWLLAMQYAQRAQGYDDNDEVNSVLLQAQTALDDMEGIVRLDFQLALSDALDSDVQIKRMLATNTDLYLLNSVKGEVIRAFLTGGGYRVDEDFQCGSGPYGGLSVGPLVDIALLPSTNPQEAALVGMDADGDLVYCIVDERPIATHLEPPDSGWGTPSAISVENGNLYVLDPLTNAVWLYEGDEFAFVDGPSFFFGLEVPEVREALDLAFNEEDLYLLNNQGGIALCQYSSDLDDPTTCEDPAEFQDKRVGREDGPQIEDLLFLQAQTTDPPEPSLYLFDPLVPAIYQFSLRLNLVRQYRPADELPEGIGTAFAVSPNRAAFLAIDNQLYIAFLP